MTITINCKATIEIEEILQNALTEVAKLDPEMSVDWQDCWDYLSENDKADLTEILAKHERGELELMDEKEVIDYANKQKSKRIFRTSFKVTKIAQSEIIIKKWKSICKKLMLFYLF